MLRFVDPEKVMAKLGQTPPKHIQDLRAKIDLRTRELEMSAGVTPDDIQEVVRWKLELDQLYADWIES